MKRICKKGIFETMTNQFEDIIRAYYPEHTDQENSNAYDRLAAKNHVKLDLLEVRKMLVESLHESTDTVTARDHTRYTDSLEPAIIIQAHFYPESITMALYISTIAPFWGVVFQAPRTLSFQSRNTPEYFTLLSASYPATFQRMRQTLQTFLPDYTMLDPSQYYLEFNQYAYPVSGTRQNDPRYLFYFLFGDRLL